jgi:hypothetical protein
LQSTSVHAMNLPQLLTGIREDTDPADIRAILDAIDETHGKGVTQAVILGRSDEDDILCTFAQGIINAYDVPSGEPPQKIWFGLYYNTIVLLNGETGAGKSSLLYNLAVYAAQNKPLFDVPFTLGRPVRVLYIDPENAGNWQAKTGGICGTKLDRIAGDREELKDFFLQFHDGRGIKLEDPRHLALVKRHIKDNQIDLVILDPIANLFATKDENDNSEAAKHMKALIELRQETGACIVICHHQGKGATTGYGRGASARLSGADVGMMLNVRTDQEDEVNDDYDPDNQAKRADVCRLRIIKNRVEDTAKASLFLAMAGDDHFRRVDFNVWKDTGKTATSEGNKEDQAKAKIISLLGDGTRRSADEIKKYLKSYADPKKQVGERNTSTALTALVQENVVCKDDAPKTPLYTLCSFAMQNTKGDCIAKQEETPSKSTKMVDEFLNSEPEDEEPDEDF